MTFVEHLSHYAPEHWAGAIDTLTPEIHPIDRLATRVWFAFYPTGPTPDRIASSHTFLFGHRHWPQVKRAILSAAKDSSWPVTLNDVLLMIADHATRTSQVDRDQLIGMAAVSLFTLRQVGVDAFSESAGSVQLPHWSHVRSLRQVRSARARQQWRAFGLRGYRVRFSEATPRAICRVRDGGTIASGLPAAELRCGPVCTGACAVGVLFGARMLSAIDSKEAEWLRVSGYRPAQSIEGDPLIRLACHARPSGDITIEFRRPARSI